MRLVAINWRNDPIAKWTAAVSLISGAVGMGIMAVVDQPLLAITVGIMWLIIMGVIRTDEQRDWE